MNCLSLTHAGIRMMIGKCRPAWKVALLFTSSITYSILLTPCHNYLIQKLHSPTLSQDLVTIPYSSASKICIIALNHIQFSHLHWISVESCFYPRHFVPHSSALPPIRLLAINHFPTMSPVSSLPTTQTESSNGKKKNKGKAGKSERASSVTSATPSADAQPNPLNTTGAEGGAVAATGDGPNGAGAKDYESPYIRELYK